MEINLLNLMGDEVCLYLMGLNLSNLQIAKELDISEPTAQRMTKLLRSYQQRTFFFYATSNSLHTQLSRQILVHLKKKAHVGNQVECEASLNPISILLYMR